MYTLLNGIVYGVKILSLFFVAETLRLLDAHKGLVECCFTGAERRWHKGCERRASSGDTNGRGVDDCETGVATESKTTDTAW